MFQLCNFAVLLSILRCWQLYLVLTIYIYKRIRRIISSRRVSIPQSRTWGHYFPPLVVKFHSQSFLSYKTGFVWRLFFLSCLAKTIRFKNRVAGQPRGSLFSGHCCPVEVGEDSQLRQKSSFKETGMNLGKEAPLFSKLLNSKFVPFTELLIKIY